MYDALSEALRPIRQRFLQELALRDAAVLSAARDLETGAGADAVLTDARAALHKTVGTAATLGYADLGDAARMCEEAIDNHRAGRGPDAVSLSRALHGYLVLSGAARRDEETPT